MQSSLKVKKPFYLKTYASQYKFSAALAEYTLPALVDSCLSTLLPEKVFGSDKIIDIKGRDKSAFINSKQAESYPARGDEFFYAAGKLISGKSHQGKDLEESFWCSLNSRFDSFDEPHHIIHSASRASSDSLPEYVDSRLVGKLFPVRLEYFRLGLSLFESRYTVMLGYAPVATQNLLIEADNENIHLEISAEALPKKDSLPLEKEDLLMKLDNVLKEILEFDLMSDYQQKLV